MGHGRQTESSGGPSEWIATVTTIHYSQLTVAGTVATVASSLGMKYSTGLTGRRASVTDAGLLCALGAMKESTALRQHIDGFKKRPNGLPWRDMAGPWRTLGRYLGNHTYKGRKDNGRSHNYNNTIYEQFVSEY